MHLTDPSQSPGSNGTITSVAPTLSAPSAQLRSDTIGEISRDTAPVSSESAPSRVNHEVQVAQSPSHAPEHAAATANESHSPSTSPQPALAAGAGIGSKGPVFLAPAVPIDDALRKMLSVGEGVSDLFFVVGRPTQVENFGKLTAVDGTGFPGELLAQHTEGLARTLVNDNPRLIEDIRNNGSCDSSYSVEGLARFRVNIFKQKGSYAIVMRKLNTKIPSYADLKLPPVFDRIITEKTGLVFVTGATGSGKTTTLAAMLNAMNEAAEMHIVTLEDPVEFLHPHKKATFCQRELGKDFSNFATGLRAALRQAPKVILVGEIRDRETMEIALSAAETGHVVYSTLHTISAAQAINRVLGMFSKEEESQVRDRLSETLRWIVSQRLAPKIGGGRVMIPEIMGSNLRTREAVQLGESDVRCLSDIIECARPEGWCTFEQTLREAYEADLITAESAMAYAVNKNKMRKALDAADKTLGKEDNTPNGFMLVEHEMKDKKPPAPPADPAASGTAGPTDPAAGAAGPAVQTPTPLPTPPAAPTPGSSLLSAFRIKK